MRLYLLIYLTALTFTNGMAQVSLEQLQGEWTCNNIDSTSYLANGTLTLHKNINYRYQIESCHIVTWRIENSDLVISNGYICSEPGYEEFNLEPFLIELEQNVSTIEISISENNKLKDQFEIIALDSQRIDKYPNDIYQLTILRKR
ncbi:MAG: hypothetical protein ACI8TA_002687 [Cyclobacteriaceae bacterium]|jgi:hypothetical protein